VALIILNPKLKLRRFHLLEFLPDLGFGIWNFRLFVHPAGLKTLKS